LAQRANGRPHSPPKLWALRCRELGEGGRDPYDARVGPRGTGRSAANWAIGLAVAVGVAAGVGAFTFRYAEGFSYFSTDPKACVNCHIMQPQFEGWQKGSHHAVAVCIDCHLPHAFVPKYLAKAENGWRHGQKFTTQNFREPIVVQAAGSAILQANCVACHAALIEELAPGAHGGPDAVRCVHCHAGVGHGQRAGLGGPLRASETNVETSEQTRD
jgi:cytochrome c nitrite reductase small subunit